MQNVVIVAKKKVKPTKTGEVSKVWLSRRTTVLSIW